MQNQLSDAPITIASEAKLLQALVAAIDNAA
jgi:hypothetical protein